MPLLEGLPPPIIAEMPGSFYPDPTLELNVYSS